MSSSIRPSTTLVILALRLVALAAKLILALFIANALGLADLGAYGLVVAATQIVPLLVGLGITGLVTRMHATGTELDVLRPMLRIWARLAALYLAVAMAALALPPLGPVAIALVVAITALEHLNQDLFVVMMARQRPVLASVLFAVRAGIWIYAFVGLGLVWPDLVSLHGLLLAWLAGLLVPLGVFAVATRHWPWRTAITPGAAPFRITALVRSAGPLFASDLAYNASLYADRVMLSLFVPLDQVGLYVFCWQIANAVHNLMLTSTMGIARPKLIAAWSNGALDSYRSLRRDVTHGSLALASLLAALSAAAVVVLDQLALVPALPEAWPLLGALLALNVARTATELAGQVLYTTRRDRALALSSLLILATGTAFQAVGLLLCPEPAIAVLAIALAQLVGLVIRLKTFPAEAAA